jgi:hypothetical protein
LAAAGIKSCSQSSLIERDGHLQHLEELILKWSELSREEGDSFAVEDLVALHAAKDSDNIKERRIGTGPVFGVKRQRGQLCKGRSYAKVHDGRDALSPASDLSSKHYHIQKTHENIG